MNVQLQLPRLWLNAPVWTRCSRPSTWHLLRCRRDLFRRLFGLLPPFLVVLYLYRRRLVRRLRRLPWYRPLRGPLDRLPCLQ